MKPQTTGIPLNLGANHFEGSDYNPALDKVRLTGQMLRVWQVMEDGQWRTLAEIERATGDPQASISAQLRHLRKDKWGGHTVNRRRRDKGLFEYQLIVRHPEKQLELNL